MNRSEVRRRAVRRLADLALPEPLDVRSLADVVSRRRGRPVELRSSTVDVGPCGLWLALPDRDVVLYTTKTSRLHRRHIVLHELAHALCEHVSTGEPDPKLVDALTPDIDPRTVTTMLGRRGLYDDDQELEAETMADILAQRVANSSITSTRPDASDTSPRATLNRLADTLGDTR